jgi:hypothetical protein
MAASTCARCSGAIDDDEVFTRLHDESFHLGCWHILITGANTQEAREVMHHAREAIDRAWKYIDRDRGVIEPPPEEPVVLCVICRAGIASVRELVMAPRGAMHSGCSFAPDALR